VGAVGLVPWRLENGLDRSAIRARSNSAIAPSACNCSRPAGVVQHAFDGRSEGKTRCGRQRIVARRSLDQRVVGSIFNRLTNLRSPEF
jgi:hypothetical protein